MSTEEHDEYEEKFRSSDLTLSGAAHLFWRYPSPRVIVPAAALAIAARVWAGGWSKRDAKIAAGLIAAEPFVEWMVHVHVLHQRPRTVRGRIIDSIAAQKHRKHHLDPRDPEWVLQPKQTTPFLVAGLTVVNMLAFRSLKSKLTGTATSLLLLNAFEWTHFLMHSSYKPKSGMYRRVRGAHQLHHYRNENYWFGIVSPLSDIALNTYPKKQDAPRSNTAKTLGVNTLEAAQEDLQSTFRT